MINLVSQFAAGCSGSGFFEFPTWYKYLLQNGKMNESDCTIVSGFQLADIWDIVKAVIEMGIYAAGIIAVVMIIWGGFKLIISQGSPDSINEARKTVLFAIIGLIISISARVIMNVVNGLFV